MGHPSEPDPPETLRIDPDGAATVGLPATSPSAETERISVDPAVQVIAGRYEILGLLGEGGMGRVYRVRDRELGELVALKVLQPRSADAPAAIEMFRREARLARHVTHRNVVRIFDLGDDAGRKFLTMELVDGESLAAVLARSGPLPVGRVLDLAAEVCAGLEAAHAAGVIHRDLKPGNVLIAKDGRVVLTDFGIATSPAEVRPGTLSEGFVVGTPDYMAPEQIEARADLDARADVFAMGAMLYHMLAGRPPWQGANPVATAMARLYRPATDPTSLRADVPAELSRVVLRCLAVDREARFPSAGALAAALEAIRRPTGGNAAPALRASPVAPVPFGAPAAGVKTIAVLPFRNQGAPEDAYVAEGLTEELADTLSITPGLRVRATGAVQRVAGQIADAREAGEALGVQVVVEGSVRRGAERTRITTRLVGVADGFQLWARRFERPTSELLVATDEVARAIGEALTTEVVASPRSAAPDAAAVDRYLRARHDYRQRFSAAAQARSVEGFAEALAHAPGDPAILAGYAMALVRHAWFAPADPARRARARAIAEQAVAIAPQHAEVRLALASVCLNSGLPVQALHEARAAVRANPCLAEAHELLGSVLGEAGLPEAAIEHLELAIALDPPNEGPCVWLAGLHDLLGDPAAADRWAARATSPDYAPIAAVVQARRFLAHRDVEGARAALRTLPVLPGLTTFARGVLTRFTTGVGGEWADTFLADMVAEGAAPRRQALGHQLRAEVAASEGDVDEVLHAVERAVDVGLFDVLWLDRSPSLAAARQRPGFARLRARAGEVAAAILNAYREP